MKKILFALTILAGVQGISLNSGAQIINTIAGNGTAGYSGDGSAATAAEIHDPLGMATDDSGNVYFTDAMNYRVRKVTPAGIMQTIAGTGTIGFSGDTGPATAAELNFPHGLAVAHSGNVYISDRTNSCVRMINTSGIITTVIGTPGTAGFSGDGGLATAATIDVTEGIAVDDSENIYLADFGNKRIRKVNHLTGIITTIAGNGTSGFSGDGGAAVSAELNDVHGVAVDHAGNVYIADGNNYRIRKVDASGIITTIAGTGSVTYSGDGGAATLAGLSADAIATDTLGNIYIADESNNRIRKIDASGIITTIAGNGTGSFSGDGGLATAAELHVPGGVTVSNTGNIYIADNGNNRIRVIARAEVAPAFVLGVSQSVTACENAIDAINNDLAIIDSNAGQTEIWSVGMAPVHGAVAGAYTATSTGGTVTPTGLTYTPATGYTGMDSFTVMVDDGFDTAYTTVHVTVTPLPVAGIITGTTSVCAGAAVSLADTAAGGAWSSSFTGIASVDGSGMVSGIAAGTDTIYYMLTNSCGTATVNTIISVDPLPSAGAIAGDMAVCAGGTITLTDTAAGGTWSSSATDIATVDISGAVTGTGAGTANISYTVANGCGSATAVSAVTVNPLPFAGIILGHPVVCAGDTITLADTISGGAWYTSNGAATITVAGGSLTGLSAGTDTVFYVVTNICGTDTASLAVSITGTVAVTDTIAGRSWVCVGDTTSLMNTSIGGTWLASNGNATINSTGTVTGVLPGTDTINYIITGGCNADTARKQVTVFTTAQCDSMLSVNTLSSGNVAEVEIYPNPFNDYLVAKGCNKGYVVIVADMTGREVVRYTCSGNNATERIAMPPLVPALYFVHIVSEQGEKINDLKLLKE